MKHGRASLRANRLFLSIIIFHLISTVFFSLVPAEISLDVNLVLGELMLLVPTILFLVFGEEKVSLDALGFRKIKWSTFFLTVLYVFLLEPLIIAVNAISMLFVDNTVLEASDMILEVPYVRAFFYIAIFAPFVEEMIFRGILFQDYKKDGSTWGAVILSAVAFSFMHMNFNQAAYAFVIGVAFALLMVATDSLWPSILGHFLINGSTTVELFLSKWLDPGALEQVDVSPNSLYLTIGIYSGIALFTTCLAWLVLRAIAKKEGRREILSQMRDKGEDPKKRISFSLILSWCICLIYMTAIAGMMYLLKKNGIEF